MTIGIAGMVLLVPKNPRHFADVMAVVVLIVLVACYLGVALVPPLTIHQASDVLEPELAGDWRGVFGHKNEASAAMVLFVFIGIFVARVRSLGLGAVIVALALPFLYFTHSKTAIAALPLALIVSVIMARAAKPANGVARRAVASGRLEPALDRIDLYRADPRRGRCDHAGCDLYRPHRHLEIRPGSRGATPDHRLRLCHVLGHRAGRLRHERRDLGQYREPRAQRLSSTWR